MKKKNLCFISMIAALCFSCGGGNQISFSSHKKIVISSSKEGKTYTPEEVEITETLHSIENKRQYNTRVLPSTGDVNLLVIPVLLPDYQTIDLDGDGKDDKENVRSNIQEAFFGKDVAYESVSSYYEKSSYGKLKLKGTVTDWFDISTSGLPFTNAVSIDVQDTFDVVESAIEWCKNILHMDMTQYDTDKDGYIDGVWLIYSCPNYTNGGPRTDENNYWAYTSWGNQNEDGDVTSPIYNLFGWASYDFLFEGYGKSKLDTHTYIHEMGHFLGLNDYYSDSSQYSPIGRVDMMDGNIIDHNSYSKMLLGWTKPYLVTGNAEIDLYSMENENACIVIPDDDYAGEDGKFDPFGEYLLLELYTNDHLNYKDSKEAVLNRPLAMNGKGVRIYHVDKRKFVTDTTDSRNPTCKIYEGENIDSNHKFILPIDNSRGASLYNSIFQLDYSYNLFDEIRMIEKGNMDTFSTGGYQKDKSLFVEGDVFTMEKYGKNFFPKQTTFNNGHTFSYTISVLGGEKA